MIHTDFPPERIGSKFATDGRDDYLEPSTKIVLAIADRIDAPVDELPPLYHVLDPEALDQLLDAGNPALTISFEYAGYAVLARGDGRIELEPAGR